MPGCWHSYISTGTNLQCNSPDTVRVLYRKEKEKKTKLVKNEPKRLKISQNYWSSRKLNINFKERKLQNVFFNLFLCFKEYLFKKYYKTKVLFSFSWIYFCTNRISLHPLLLHTLYIQDRQQLFAWWTNSMLLFNPHASRGWVIAN